MKRVAGVLVGVALILGFRFYERNVEAHDLKARLFERCGQDLACAAAVDHGFSSCFEESYEMGERRPSSRVESEPLVQCVNRRSGKNHFSVSQAQR